MKSVLITGANRGLGFAMAESFYQKGYRVYTVVRNDEAKAIIHQHFPESFVLIADVTDTDYQTRLQEFLADKKLDVVINNAGSGGNRGVRTDLCTPEHLMTEFSSHCVGALSTVQGTLASLKHAEHPVVVNISSRRGSLH
ncbi:SDR family NAD(P)-dependent oxidoreductase, partial [Veronia pacifica]